MKLGIEKNATIRVRAGISYALTEAMDDGHCGLPTDQQGEEHPQRRSFLHLAAGAAALPAMTRIARAQAYRTQPVHLIVGFPPGGTPPRGQAISFLHPAPTTPPLP
jgi:hypothetical protein